MKAIYDELSAIGNNVNQIARAVNRGQAPPLREAADELALLKFELRKVLPALNAVVAEARRSNERLCILGLTPLRLRGPLAATAQNLRKLAKLCRTTGPAMQIG